MIESMFLSLEDLQGWDEFVHTHQCGHVFQLTQWAAYRASTGWQPFFLAIKENGALRAVCTILHRSLWGMPFGGILYISRGPVLDYEGPLAPSIFYEILTQLKKLAIKKMAVLWISPDVQEINAPWIKSVLHEAGFKRAKSPIQHETTVRLNLNAPLDQIIAQMEKRRREDIRKYEREKQNWATGWSTSRDSLNTLYSLHKTTMLRVQRQPKGFEYLSKICEYLGPNRSCLIFVVDYNGQPAASIFLLGTSKRLWAVYGGSDRRVVSDADVAVHWEIIKWAHQHGYQEYDLQGFPDEVERDNPLYGIYLFKRGWGGQVVILIGEYTYAPVPGMLGILNWLLRKMRMVI